MYDVEIYLKHFKDSGFLSNADHILFMWNTDGVPFFKSLQISIQSIFLVINNLQPSLRYKSEKIVFAGIWYGTRKPETTLFLEALYREFEFMEKGILGKGNLIFVVQTVVRIILGWLIGKILMIILSFRVVTSKTKNTNHQV